MKKCGIVTITGGTNYGNKLQNYALQKIMQRFGLEPETIRFKPKYPENDGIKKIKRKIIEWNTCGTGAFIHDITRIAKKRINQKLDLGVTEMRNENFRRFVEANIKMSSVEYCAQDDLSILNTQYDVFIAGSDQIWNPFWEGINPFYFLNFADGKKRFAYAPSFGVADIPSALSGYYKEMLNGIPHLSIREEQGRQIIRTLIQRDVPVLLDPTFLLTHKEWLRIAKRAGGRPKDEYLLTYFLGKKSYIYYNAIAEYARERDLHIVALNDFNKPACYSAGPAEFIDLIAEATLVCTDSYHGCALSTIFNKPFIVFERESRNNIESMNSRIETLLKMLDLQNRKYGQVERSNIFEVDFNRTNFIIQRQKERSFNYLRRILL